VSPERLFFTVLVASLLSFGGLGSLPVVRNELLSAQIPPDGLILQSLAVGNIGPGPNGLYLVAIGYFVSGPLGALIATAALLLPPLLVLVLERVRARLIHLPRFQSALESLGLAVVALVLTTSGNLASHAVGSPLEIAMMVASAAVLLLLRWVPTIAVVVGAIGVGLLVGPVLGWV
jgi:chromate transporter